jgi:hypothetical protein
LLCGAPPLETAVISEAASFLEISRASLGFVQAACPMLAAEVTALVTRAYLGRQRMALHQAVDRS